MIDMTDPATFVIVGAGLAGATAAETLRAEGFDGRVVLLGSEPHRPYERPALSKGYLQGSTGREKVFVHPASWYDEQRIDLRVGTAVTGLDARAHEVIINGAARLRYDKLLLTTGAAPRGLTVPGWDLNGVHYLRTLDDSDRLRAALTSGTRVAVIGGGWIGLETAAAGRAAGAEVTVLEREELPLLRILGPRVAGVFADLHTDHGVDLRCGVTVTGIRPAATSPAAAGAVVLADGAPVEADVVIVGIGVTPNDGLARVAGLTVDNGIVVDERLRTSDPDIFAAGDVANASHPGLGRPIRVEHWANALHQPVVAARSMLGQRVGYDRLPYFFTDQYELGMEYTGFTEPDGYDEVVIRGDLGAREFIAFWLRDRRVLAGMNVNVWDVTDAIKALITSRHRVDPAALADPDRPLAGATG
jgi:3-phenylpropionate/trans-cinnamate dioxygenase ferredoxin reductase subunit